MSEQMTKKNSAVDLDYNPNYDDAYSVTIRWDLQRKKRNDDYKNHLCLRFADSVEAQKLFDAIAWFGSDQKINIEE
jgi:hypothetical protein